LVQVWRVRADSEDVTLPACPLPETTDARLEACLRRIEAREGFPALTQRIQEITAVLGDEDASVQRLANIVLRDYALTVRVIRAANSFHFNRSGRPVLTATHAMVLLGVRAVRDLVSGIVLFEHCQRQSPGLKHLMLLSMLTANHAREVAQRVNAAQPEALYLCGMFRNLGEVLTASCLEDKYADILREMTEHKRSQREACRKVLGFEYQDLGQAMARRWGMPAEIDRAIRADETPRDLFERITVFGEALTNAVYRRDQRLAPPSATAVLQKHGQSLGLGEDDLRAVLEAAVSETRDTFRVMRVALDDLRLRHQVGTALAGEAAPPPPPQQAGARAPGARPDGCPQHDEALDLGAQMAAEVEAALKSSEGIDLHRVLLMTIEAALRGGGFDRAVFALVTADRTELLGRLGLGKAAEALVERFRFPLGPRGGALGIAMARQQELVLSREWDLRTEEADTLTRFGASAIVALPVVVSSTLVGCMAFDRVDSNAVADGQTLTLLRRLRDAAAQAMAERRA
jgi:HD-like signal output (HDOD) protein